MTETETQIGMAALVRELADYDAQIFPLAGGDVLAMLIRFGLATAEEVKGPYGEVMKQYGHYEWPPTYGPATKTDDEIPF